MAWIALISTILGLVAVPATGHDFSNAEIDAAFASASGGFSADEVMIQDSLRARFLSELNATETHSEHFERDALLALLQLRKSGDLTTKATRRGKPVDESIVPIAEIAARVVMDRHRISSDTLLADPAFRKELDHEAQKIASGTDTVAIRKAVLSLRKRRALKPELVLRVADWQRKIETYSLEKLQQSIASEEISDGPGVYLFRTAGGYLYIGEAKNLRLRLSGHLAASDRASLAEYLRSEASAGVTVELHVFPSDSPAKRVTVRRAYESELIRSRQPRLNVRP
ncbi:excinuclease ABC subunit C [Rhodopirellula maiorica SM1]|uniref:Excinuclease ABC subunit C n=1 Tax=Rhodopirellula maiorica SM1 TaxID=1265738 RepID=M5S2D2_9BACT|nr:excinuclease ABC subunit C [Rhodopirellula maiorica SM1]